MSREAFVLPKYVGTNVSFEREPRNAIEYLMSVRKEAETIPDVVSVHINVYIGLAYTNCRKKQSLLKLLQRVLNRRKI